MLARTPLPQLRPQFDVACVPLPHGVEFGTNAPISPMEMDLTTRDICFPKLSYRKEASFSGLKVLRDVAGDINDDVGCFVGVDAQVSVLAELLQH